MDYDFSTLSPHDFELLTKDLLQHHLEFPLEGFKSGPDDGIDLRYCGKRSASLIVQCKHYARSAFSKLKNDLAKNEYPKIVKLAPNRYIIVTSRPLSPREKNILFDVLQPYCQSTSDILGAADLNALLRKYRTIEKTHFKLWIASTEVLRTVLHNNIFSRNYLEIEEIKTRLSLFVSTAAVKRAIDALEKYGFCLLSGIPGIGKTTTAEMLVALLLDKEWECICVNSNIEEAFTAYDETRRQVFYYDDFLGQASLSDKLDKNEDHDLSRLIRACGKRPKMKRLILTTRNYLLAQAIEQHEALKRAKLDSNICLVELSDYTPQVRAQILVNHLWFYSVSESWCRSLVKSKAARKIVDHPNYNPRLIETICNGTLNKPRSAKAFADNALAWLDDPADLWRHVYQNQLSNEARELLVCFASLGDGCCIEALRIGYHAFSSKDRNDLLAESWFHRALRELEGTFVRVDPAGNTRTVAYHNPSVEDFMDGTVASTPSYPKRILQSAAYYDQVKYASRFALANKRDLAIEKEISKALQKHLFGESAVPEKIHGEKIRAEPIRPAQRLLSWRRNIRDTSHEILKAELYQLAVAYLNSGDYGQDEANEIAKLARFSWDYLVAAGVDPKLKMKSINQWLWLNLKSIDDYTDMGDWIDRRADDKAKSLAQKRLKEDFIEFADSLLDDLAEGDNSASDISDGITAIIVTADELGIDATEIDTSSAESALEAAEEREDEEADMRNEERQLLLLEELVEDEEVNDILDSLR